MKNKFIEQYQQFLKQNTDSEKAKKEKAYLYSNLEHYGASLWERRKFVNEYMKEIKSWDKKTALRMARKFWAMPSFEERAMGLTILNIHADELDISDMQLIEKMMRESKGWAFLDSLIIPIMPKIIEKEKKAYKYLKKWINDDDFWVRRSALLAQLLFFRKGDGGDKKLFFDMAESQMDENWIDELYKGEMKKRAKFFIRKAIGWTLREMSGKDPRIVVKFTKKNKQKMSGLSYREATRKLPEKYKKLL